MAVAEATFERKALNGQVLTFLFWLGMTTVGVILTPDPSGHGTHTQLGMPPCPSVLLFDRPCPGCGLTTSFTAFLQFDFATAFRAHALGPLMYLAITGYALAGAVLWLRRQPLELSMKMHTILSWAMGLFLLFGLVRAGLHQGYGGGPEARFVEKLQKDL